MNYLVEGALHRSQNLNYLMEEVGHRGIEFELLGGGVVHRSPSLREVTGHMGSSLIPGWGVWWENGHEFEFPGGGWGQEPVIELPVGWRWVQEPEPSSCVQYWGSPRTEDNACSSTVSNAGSTRC